MGCGACAAKAGVNNTTKYVYTAPNGETKVYRTEIEAVAAKTARGGSYAPVTK